ncbi:MAG TPA: hypothetical protein PK263_04945 [bacterium]|nr:hypothetical protein [bacterium]
MPKFICLDPYDTFTSADEYSARQHAANNPGHKVVEVEEDGDEIKTTSMELDVKEES